MTRRFTIAILIIAAASSASAQQHGIYSQYLFNLFVVNPAYAGELDALAASLSYRAQWVGFKGAPKTQNFSVHSPVKGKKMALGLQFQNDEIGARRTPSLSATYAYKIKLNDKSRLSFGVEAGVINYQYRWQDLNYRRSNDPVAFGSEGNKWVPNFNFGVMYLRSDAYIGLSATSLNSSRIIASDNSDARLNTFFNLIAGKVYDISEKVALKPSTIVRKALNSPFQFDANLSLRYLNRFWLTTTYRYDYGAVFSGHIYITDNLHVGYSYDLPLNNLLTYQSGSHEVFIGYNFNVFAPLPKSQLTY